MRRASAVLVVPALSLVLFSCGGGGKARHASSPAPRAPAACQAGRFTPAATEGPFYKPGSPQRERLVDPGLPGSPLTIIGVVRSSACKPVAHALLQFWQADSSGQYDNRGFRLRGHEFTDAQGRYRLETIRPGLYTGRTRHIHVKVQPTGGPVFTTQLYFPGEPRNSGDMLFDPKLLLSMSPGGSTAAFDFVVRP